MVLALLGFMLVVVATPRQWFPVFGLYFVILLVVIAVSRVPFGYIAKRMVVETPFVLFALLVPFVATGPQTEVLGVSVSEPGLLAAWGLLAVPFVRYDGEGRPPVTDGPFAETKDLIAGWMAIDVDSYERAIELAGELSAAPGAGGKPIHEWLEVRPFYGSPTGTED